MIKQKTWKRVVHGFSWHCTLVLFPDWLWVALRFRACADVLFYLWVTVGNWFCSDRSSLGRDGCFLLPVYKWEKPGLRRFSIRFAPLSGHWVAPSCGCQEGDFPCCTSCWRQQFCEASRKMSLDNGVIHRLWCLLTPQFLHWENPGISLWGSIWGQLN